jgi:signal transduction histidine kinase/ligand-binding sensor domain-containing protein
MKAALALITISTVSLLLGAMPVLALDPSLDVSQYAHTAWTVRDGFSMGNIYAMAQTPDGYLWLGTEFGLFRFDGLHSVQWQPPPGQQLPDKNINSLLVTHDGTLWIGTFVGLVTWSGGKLSRAPVLADQFVSSLFEDREGTVWAASLENHGRLCAIRDGNAHCYGEDGAFGRAVWALYEDSSGILWAAAESGLWRVKPGPPRRYPTNLALIGLNKADDGRLLIAAHNAGVMQLVGDKLQPYLLRGPTHRVFNDRDVDSNRLLRDRDGGLWIGTVERGLIHVHRGRTDLFTRSDGLSGDVILSVFEDREGNVWVASTGGLDRFRELPVSTISTKQGLFSDATSSVLAATDGSVWVGSQGGLTRWHDGQTRIFGKADGLPDDAPQSLFEDYRGRIWVFTRRGPAYFEHGKFVSVNGVPADRVHSVAGDTVGNLWLSDEKSFLHLREGRVVEQIPWSGLRHRQSAEGLLFDRRNDGVWLGFWVEGGVAFFKDGRLRASYTASEGLGEGAVGGLELDPDGTLWAATYLGGLSRINGGRITTLTSTNGLPCNTIHWSIEDDDRSLWLYTACGLVRIARSELNSWIADPKRRIEITVWDAADGVKLRSTASGEYGPRVAKTSDGKIWFTTGEGVQVIDPHHLPINKIPPPVHIEKIIADQRIYWQNLPGAAVSNLRLPARTRDLTIDYTALSLVAPEKVHFKYKLEGQDQDWREVVNDRQVQYSNLPPRHYRFRVMASNNSGVWNEQGDTLEFSVAPAYYQTNWFRALCAAAFLLLVWATYQLRVRQLQREFDSAIEARVSERTRIARELHDTLLQSLQALLFQYQAARNLFANGSERALQVLDATLDRTEQAIADSRDAIQDIRSDIIAHNALPELLARAGTDLAESQGDQPLPTFGVTVEGARKTVPPIIREETYRIALELLRNAFRHSNAHRIEAEVRYDNDTLRLRIRDDGRGMDLKVPQESTAGHWGLRGVRERAERIGAKLDVWSEVGAGTEFQLTIPAGIAYVGSGDSLPSRLLRKVKEYAHRN